MAKLQEHSMTSAVWGDTSDEVTYADLLSTVRLPPRTCHALLKKLLAVILRPDTSELLKRRWVIADPLLSDGLKSRKEAKVHAQKLLVDIFSIDIEEISKRRSIVADPIRVSKRPATPCSRYCWRLTSFGPMTLSYPNKSRLGLTKFCVSVSYLLLGLMAVLQFRIMLAIS